jgi:hypothetical protein
MMLDTRSNLQPTIIFCQNHKLKHSVIMVKKIDTVGTAKKNDTLGSGELTKGKRVCNVERINVANGSTIAMTSITESHHDSISLHSILV